MTSRNKLSRRERDARMKLVQELRLNKNGQRGLDQYVARSGHKYEEVRRNKKYGAAYTFELNTKNVAETMEKLGIDPVSISHTFRRLFIAISEII